MRLAILALIISFACFRLWDTRLSDEETVYRESLQLRLDFMEAKQCIVESIQLTGYGQNQLKVYFFSQQFDDALEKMKECQSSFIVFCDRNGVLSPAIDRMDTALQTAQELKEYVTSANYSPELMQSWCELSLYDESDNINTLKEWLDNPTYPKGENYIDYDFMWAEDA